jgi:hypothetical protein
MYALGSMSVLWNHVDDGPSHIGPLLGRSESMQGGTLGTNHCHVQIIEFT